MKDIRVLELRAAENGWVLSAFETESNYRQACVFKTMVAETPETAAQLALNCMCEESWQRAVVIPPARRNVSGTEG